MSLPSLMICEICGSDATSKNFGATACRSCAAFFRRATEQSKPYRCKKFKRCDVTIRRNVHRQTACAYCRFMRCLEVGMTPIERHLPNEPSSIAAETAYLSRLALFRRTLFRARLQGLRNEGWLLAKGAPKEMVLVTAEIEQCLLRDYFSHFDAFANDWTPEVLAQHFYVVWLLFEYLLASARNRCYERNLFCLPNDKTMLLEEKKFVNFWIRYCHVAPSDAGIIARITMDNVRNQFSIASSLKAAQLDDVEASAMFQLLIAHYGRRAFVSRTGHSAFINGVLKELRAHYAKDSREYATRLDIIANLLGEFHASPSQAVR